MSGARRSEGGGWAEAAWILVPIVAGIPVLIGIVQTLANLVQSPWPDLGWANAISADAGAFFVGDAPYGNPATDYTGQLYFPLFPFLISLVDRLWFWEGWPLFVAVIAGGASMAMVAWVALPRRPGRSWTHLLAALGIGGVAWSLVASLYTNALFEGRADQVAWALALGGALLQRRAMRQGGVAVVLAPIALTCALWTKQSAGVAALAAFAWSVLWIYQTKTGRRRLVLGVGLFALLNAAVAAVFAITSDGWQWYIEFELPQRYARPTSLLDAAGEFVGHARLALILVGVVVVIAALAGRHEPSRGGWRPGIASLMAMFVFAALASGLWFRGLVGAADNHFIGAVWGLGVLLADGWRRCDGVRKAQVATSAALALVALTVFLPARSFSSFRHGKFIPTVEITTVDPEVRSFAAAHDVFNIGYSDLAVKSRGVVYPQLQGVLDLLWGGRQPGWLVDALLERRIEYVYPMYPLFDSGGAGRYEEGYFWKLDQIILAKYVEDPATPILPGEGNMVRAWRRRPGPDPAPWLRRCFGPFDLGGVRWAIRLGGGLWCTSPAPDSITLRGAPETWSELRTQASVEVLGGSLGVAHPKVGGGWSVDFGSWRVEGRTRNAGVAVRSGGAQAEAEPDARGRITLRFVGSGEALSASRGVVRVPVPEGIESPLSLWATNDGSTRFEFGALRLRG